ncbi:MAG: hypothetical protein V3U09_06790 [Thermoplasmata archaeon]
MIGDDPWIQIDVGVSEASSVTIYERTGGYNIVTYDVATLTGPGGSFSTGAFEEYTVTSDGNVLTIHCFRPNIDGGGNNIVATRLDGVAGFPNGLWATRIDSYTVGIGGIPETRFNALGEHMLNHTVLGDDHSEIVLGYSYVYRVLPPSNLTTAVQGSDVTLSWTPSPSFGIDYYKVYAGPTPRSIDLTNPIGSTQFGSSTPLWTHFGGASNQEQYYLVRAYNATYGLESYTSNTAGIFAIQFEKGRNAFSLPLEPFNLTSVSDLWNRIPGSQSLFWMGPDDRWVGYEGPGYPDTTADVGRGYMVDLQQAVRFVFTGLPGSMIKYKDGFGFDSASRGSLNGIFGNDRVLLQWSRPTQNGTYFRILRSDSREGFFEQGGYREIGTIPYSTTPLYYADLDPFSDSDTVLYMIVPVDPSGRNGSSSFSLAVIRMEFDPGIAGFGLPVRTFEIHSVDSLSTSLDPVVGVSYFISGVWKFHAKEMPSWVYYVPINLGEGYQISVDLNGPVTVEFIGM